MWVGPMFILLEDLGFERRNPTIFANDIIEMTYHHHFAKHFYEKIFADINETWVIEVCVVPEEMHIDRWKKEGEIYIVSQELSVDLYNPKSIGHVSKFVNETIVMAKE